MRIWLAFLGLCSCSVLVDLDGMRGDGADAASEASPVDDAGRCIPRTCESIGANCGPVSDGCGAIIKKGGVESCGTCTGSLTCSAVVPNVCGSPSLYGGKHTKSDCETAGGQARNIGVAGDAGVPQSLCARVLRGRRVDDTRIARGVRRGVDGGGIAPTDVDDGAVRSGLVGVEVLSATQEYPRKQTDDANEPHRRSG